MFIPSDKERYMQNIPEQDRLLITNPLIDFCAVALAAPYVAGGANRMYIIAEEYSIVQFFIGVVEGWEKGKMETGPYMPYLYDSPAFQAGSDFGAWLYEAYRKYIE